MEKEVKNKQKKEKIVVKKATKPVKKIVEKKETVASAIQIKRSVPRKHGDLKVEVFSTDGLQSGTLTLPDAVFAAKVNESLMAQAVRIYLANQREGSASTKTRGEVQGSTRKIYKQKGTGRARHGAIRAPIFVKGGIALGPKPRDHRLNFSKQMKKKAVASALTTKLMNNAVKVVSDMKNIELKTKAFDAVFRALEVNRKTLVLFGNEEREIIRGMRNLPYIDVLRATDVHTYAVLNHRSLVFTKDAIKELETLYKEHTE